MGIMDRLSRLIRANVNDVMDRAEDPEKTLNQLLRDMYASIGMARAQVVAMVAQERELEADLIQTRKLAAEWGQKARAAVNAGKDDLAREALRRKRDNEANTQIYEQQFQVQQQTVTKIKAQLRQIESKYQTTLSQRDVLIARARRAKATEKVASTLSTFSPLDPQSDLDRMERKIRGREARAAALTEMAGDSLDAQFQELADPSIEAELAALKSGASAFGAGQGGTAAVDFSELEEFDIEAELLAIKSGDRA